MQRPKHARPRANSYDPRRKELEKNLKLAALELFEYTGRKALLLQVPGTMETYYLAFGTSGTIKALAEAKQRLADDEAVPVRH